MAILRGTDTLMMGQPGLLCNRCPQDGRRSTTCQPRRFLYSIRDRTFWSPRDRRRLILSRVAARHVAGRTRYRYTTQCERYPDLRLTGSPIALATWRELLRPSPAPSLAGAPLPSVRRYESGMLALPLVQQTSQRFLSTSPIIRSPTL